MRVLRTVILLGSLVGVAASQTPNTNNVGMPENGVIQGSQLENVQLNNRNLHIEIPLWSSKGRGLDLGYKYVYDHKQFYLSTNCNNHTGMCNDLVRNVNGVLTLVGPAPTITPHERTCGTVGLTVYRSYNYTLTDSDDTQHQFPAVSQTGNNCGLPALTTVYADDGSGWMLVLDTGGSPALYGVSKSGVRVNFSSGPSAQDANGNQITLSGSTGTDTLGRTFYTDGSYYDSSGALQHLVVTTTTAAVQTSLCRFSIADSCGELTGNWTVPQVIQLPNGLQYTFSYNQNSYGEPTSVTLPSGGQVTWTWGAPIDAGGLNVNTRSRTVAGVTETWSYSGSQTVNSNTVTATDPANNDTVSVCTVLEQGGTIDLNPCFVTSVSHYSGTGGTRQLLKTVATDYLHFSTDSPGPGTYLPIRETTTWSQQNLVSKVETDWDRSTQGGIAVTWKNPVEKREYAYGTGAPGALVRRTHFNYLHLTNSAYRNLNIADRRTSKIVYDGSGSTKAQTTFAYDGSALVSTSGTPAPSHDYTNFGSTFLTRGNLTQVSRWLNTNGTWLSTNNTYDDLGNLRTSQDPGLHTTTFDYTDSWGDSACTLGSNTFAFLTQVTDALSHRVRKSYFRCTGLVQSSKDENDIVAARAGATFTYDLMNRTVQVNRPDGGQTTYCFSDVAGSSCYSASLPLTRTQTDTVTSGLNVVKTTILDGLGRVQQDQLHDPDCGSGTGLVKIDYAYGFAPATNTAFTKVSTPYCNSPDATYGLMATTNYDALHRVSSGVQTDGSTASTVYAGNCTTGTDEAGKARKSCFDALGRLIQVFEDPSTLNYETDYGYDTLDNMTGVTQKGGDSNSANWRNRSFVYDSLSRLTSATNPESGTITYTYDADSNVLTKVAPIPNKIPGDTSSPQTVTTTYSYDQVHRLYRRTYTDSTPTVNYGYDGLAGPSGCTPAFTPSEAVGYRTSMCDGAGTATWDYFVMGRIKKEQRTLGTVTKIFNYTYNYDGSVASLTYPSARTITYTPNSSGNYTAGRTLSAIDSTNSINYMKSASYKPDGALASMVNGYTASFAGITTTTSYNTRLQPVIISASAPSQTVLSLSYDFHLGAGDNGNVFQEANNRDTTRTVNYTYDALNRVTSGYTTSNRWGDNYVIDPWGNLYQKNAYTGKTAYDPLTQTANNKNQFAGMCYDKAGNLLGQNGACPASPPYTGTYTYNAEGQMTVTAGVTYTYDGDGKRVKKSNGTLYWTSISGAALVETDLSGTVQHEYIFVNGKRVARLDPPSTVMYFFSDHLGSHDVVTNATGTILNESDYGPYGEERVITSNLSPQNYKFTGKERDLESGLDEFGARHYSSALGRFMVPDSAAAPIAVPYAQFGNPQSLNLYSYVVNNGPTLVDPDGHFADNGVFGATSDAKHSDVAALGGIALLSSWKLDDDNNNNFPQGGRAGGADPVPDQAQNLPGSGEGSQANLDRRAAIAANAVDAAERAALGQNAYGPNQCSTFVSDQIVKAGGKIEFTPNDGPPRPPVAGELHNPNANITNTRVLKPGERPLPGDIAAVRIQNPHHAATGDSAIVVTGKNGLSAVHAGDHGVRYNPLFIRGHSPNYYDNITYRRYTGD